MSGKKRWLSVVLQAVLAMLIIAAGIFVGKHFISSRQEPRRMPKTDTGVLVEVSTVSRSAHPIRISATGEATPTKTTEIKSEISGRIVWVNPDLVPGAHLKADTEIVRINTEDYAIRLEQAKITLSQRQADLKIEEAKGRAARAELQALRDTILSPSDITPDDAALIRRVPQLQQAMAAVEMARTQVRQAELDFERSVIKIPYDAVVLSAPSATGDYVSPATSLAKISSDTEMWITVSLPPQSIAWIGATSDSLNAVTASVSYDMAGTRITRKARPLSVMGEVEPLGRMVRIMLAVDEPYGDPINMPLLAGTFLYVDISPATTIEAVKIPRAWVREGNSVYVCSQQNTLEIRDITTPYKTESDVYVTNGLAEGDRVVTTLISSPVPGRKLRIRGQNDK